MSTVFVGNLAANVSDADLRALFTQYGEVTSLRLIGRRGIAFVELAPEAADSAVAGLTGTQLNGRTLDVAIERSRGGGGRQGGPRRRR